MILDINGISLEIEPDSMFNQLREEIEGPYDFDSIPFEKGDVVLDIGAHQGIVSMYLAKRFPGLRIYAYEPIVQNFEILRRNLAANGITNANVWAHPLAVTADGRNFPIIRGHHSAEATGFFHSSVADRAQIAESTTIGAIVGEHNIERVKLLKLDCEGAEHEILRDSAAWIDQVDYVRGEIHMIPTLAEEGYTVEGTKAMVPPGKARWQVLDNPELLGAQHA